MSGAPQGIASPALPNQRPDNAHSYVDSQRSLQNASMELDAAYNRIRQVRRSLLQVTEPRAILDPPRLSSHNEIRPRHQALVLSEGSGEEEDNQELEALLGLDLEESYSADRFGFAQGGILSAELSAPRANPQTRNRNEASERSNSPAPTVLPPRFSRQPEWSYLSQLQQQGANPQSAATTRGLQVAAREAGLALPTNGAESYMQRTGIDFASLAAEYRDILEAQRRSNAEFDSRIGRARNVLMRARDLREGRPTASSVPTSAQASATIASGRDAGMWRLPQTRSWYSERHRELSALSDSTDASLRQLSGDADELSARAASDTRSRRSYPVGEQMQSPEGWTLGRFSISDDADRRDDEFMSWLYQPDQPTPQPFPEFQVAAPELTATANGDSGLPTRTTNTAIPPRELSARRGWARLDADGNEIPYSEEEELERTRTEYRLRALRRARQHNAPSTGNGLRTTHGSVLDSTLNVPTVRNEPPAPLSIHQPTSDVRPFRVDPLPMPLSSMMNIPKVKDECHPDVIVPRHACLAGR